MHGIREMVQCFARTDKNQNYFLDREEFKWALKELGIQFTKTEFDNIFKYFDKNCDD